MESEPHVEGAPGERYVFWEPVPPDVRAWEAELPDGTRLRPVMQLGGRRLGFDRPLPAGTRMLHNGHVYATLT